MHHSSIAGLALVTAVAVAAPAAAAPVDHVARAGSAASYAVTATINTALAIGKETTLKVRGRVTPKAAGQKVVLQQRVGNKRTWKGTGTAKIKRNGTYVLKDEPATPGTRAYRVLKPASDGLAKGFSPTLEVEVYAWQKLASRTAGPTTNLLVDVGTLIGTDYYGASLVSDVSGSASSIEYTLGRKCLQMRATYALTDSSASGSSGAVVVSADGAVLASHALAVGTVVADSIIDIEDAFRLKLDLSTTSVPAAAAAVGTPEVLCTR